MAEKASTSYVILKRVSDEGDGNWNPIGAADAGSGPAAVKAFLNIDDNGEKFGEGEYRGVAERSWGEPVAIQKKISFG